MRKTLLSLFFILLLTSCGKGAMNVTQAPNLTATIAGVESPTPTTTQTQTAPQTPTQSPTQTITPERLDFYHKASAILSLHDAAELWWTADGKIICSTCILQDGTRVPWGQIDPLTGYFEALSPEDFEIPSQISQSDVLKNDEILLYLLSPSKEKAILYLESKSQQTRSLANYSLSEGVLKEIPFTLDFCVEEGIHSFQEWSSDNRYVLASCWMANVGEDTLTSFIVDTDNGTIYDLREAVGTIDGVMAAFSSDAEKVAVVDYRNFIYIFQIDELFSEGDDKQREMQAIEVDTVWLDQMKWSMDDQYIYFYSYRTGEQLLCRVDIFTSEVETVFDCASIQTVDDQTLPTFYEDWYLSPDNRYILLHHRSLVLDNTLWLFHLDSGQ